MKALIIVLSLISAIVFASIFAQPAANPHNAARAWAHGVGYVLPRVIGTLCFATASLALIGIDAKKKGYKKTLKHPVAICAYLLLLPALYTFIFTIRVLISITIGI